MTESPILQDLNPPQKEAVTWPLEKPLLVLAGAGSGKTRILTRRIAHLISQGVPAFNLLGVTFTNKAAEEMRKRVRRLVRQEVWVSTFHSTCLRILREEAPALGLARDFLIYDELDQLVLLKECLKEMNIPERRVHPKGARELIQRAKDYLLTPYQFLEKASDDYEETVGKVYVRYEEKLVKLGGLDFGDLILKTVFLFDRHAKILEAWQDRLHYILIDEYQDTNHAQYRFIKLLASKYQKITVVGDPDQSIYGWRGADIRNILNFEHDYPEAGTIKMEQNYRSPATILEAANALIQHNEFRKPKLLWGEKGSGESITLYEAADEKDEAEFVVQEILQKHREGRTLNEIAVFYRVHAQSRVFEDALRRAKIPYKIVGGIRFYDRKEIKDLLAYLRAVAVPGDDVSLKRILNVPSRGIGKKALEHLENLAHRHNLSFDETLHRAREIPELGPRAVKAIVDFTKFLGELRAGSDFVIARRPSGRRSNLGSEIASSRQNVGGTRNDGKVSIRELLEDIIEKTEYVKLLEEERTIEAQARIENIEEFFSVIDDFEENLPLRHPEAEGRRISKPEILRSAQDDSPLQAFIDSISLVTDIDTWDSGSNCLTLMTLHCAKGLEFPIVFMVGLEAGLFPNGNALSGDLEEELEEERRLCYVGITRTQEKLYLTYASSRRIYGQHAQNLPSRFLTEIPSELMESRVVEIDYDLEN